MLKIYIYRTPDNRYRLSTRIPETLKDKPQELTVPKEAAYLLLASQNGVDALQDALNRMYNNGADHFLTWMEDENGVHFIGLDEPDANN